MRKYSIIVIITLLLSFGICPTAFAAGDSNSKVLNAVAKTDVKIEKMIEIAIEKGDGMLIEFQSDYEKLMSSEQDIAVIDTKIITLKANFENNLDKLINNLIESINSKTSKMIIGAEKNGVLVESSYVEVTIANRIILVDPLRVRSN